jgi:hypothetical protein
VVPKKNTFHYFGLVLQKNEDIDEDGSHRIVADWLKWRKLMLSCVTLGCHISYKENSIGLGSDLPCCIEQDVGLLKDGMPNN